MLRLVATTLSVWLCLLTHQAVAEPVLLLPYFDGNGQNGVYLAWSSNGRDFSPVNNRRPIFKPPQWQSQNLTRDPSTVWHDGLFHMVWTSH